MASEFQQDYEGMYLPYRPGQIEINCVNLMPCDIPVCQKDIDIPPAVNPWSECLA